MTPKKVLLTAATDADWQQVFNIRYGKGKFVKIKTWQDFKKFLLLSYAQENAVMNRLRSLYPNSSLSFTDPDRDYLIIGPSGTCNRYDIERINQIIDAKDEIKRIYINFCNPWPKAKHKKKRLTHTKQLEHYKEFLSIGSEIFFKTDDDELFNDSIKYFEESGFIIIAKTFDLHNDDIFDGKNIETEHEIMFSDEGLKIKALIAKLA